MKPDFIGDLKNVHKMRLEIEEESEMNKQEWNVYKAEQRKYLEANYNTVIDVSRTLLSSIRWRNLSRQNMALI